MSFSPITDVSLSKFEYADDSQPSLDLVTASSPNSYACNFAGLPDGAFQGSLAWEFFAPAGASFSSLTFPDLTDLVYADGRGSVNESAQASLVSTTDSTDSLVIARATRVPPVVVASRDDINSWVNGRQGFILQFTLSNPDYASQSTYDTSLAKIFVQVLRQCASTDAIPFQMTAN